HLYSVYRFLLSCHNKRPSYDFYFIIEEPFKCYFTEKVSHSLNPLYASDYAFREIYLIATAAENEDSAFDKAYNGLQGWVDCFEKATLKGIVMGGGINDANSATKHNDIMKDAYRLGTKL
ncbi:MAG: hypothetical protein UCN08_07040, partial [Lachnospiraceae bacterium]|nr:hypothetical protein [Lachnospiraceae bacterium]